MTFIFLKTPRFSVLISQTWAISSNLNLKFLSETLTRFSPFMKKSIKKERPPPPLKIHYILWSHDLPVLSLDWLHKQGVQFQSLEDMSRSEIASSLEQFYLSARRPNGTQYKKNTLKSIKHSLDHYLRASPLKKDFSISTDYDFRQVHA